MPYDDALTKSGKETADKLILKLSKYERDLHVVFGNLGEIVTIVKSIQRVDKVPKLDDDGHVIVVGNVPQMESKTTPEVLVIPKDYRTSKEFTDADRLKQQTTALKLLTTLKTEIDKLA